MYGRFTSRRQAVKASGLTEEVFQRLVDLRVIAVQGGDAFDLLECEQARSRVKEAAQHLGLIPIPTVTAEPGPVIVHPPVERLPN